MGSRIKEWSTEYPTSIDDLQSFPVLVDGRDRALFSHVMEPRDVVIELESRVGSNAKEAGSLRKRFDDIEALFWSGRPEDEPPASPNSKDDEFDASSLDVKWTWGNLGAPTNSGFSLSRMFWTASLSTANTNWTTASHILYQSVPAGDFTVTASMTAPDTESIYDAGIFIDDNGDSKYAYISPEGLSAAGLSAILYDEDTDQRMKKWILRLSYDSVGANIEAYFSAEGGLFAHAAQFSSITWTPSRFGLFVKARSTAAMTAVASWDWFRVT